MCKIVSLSYKNVLCFGNNLTTINFDNLGKNGSLNIIFGKNGAGKSSFIKLIKLGLYFQSDGIKIEGISNDINGNGYIAIDVINKFGEPYRIESEYTRSKLNVLNVYKNGSSQPEDWGKIPETKERINKDIVDIPYHIFSNILSLSVNDFKSFLSMTPKDSRNIRDRIFGFYILNEMNEMLKENIKSYATKYTEISVKISSLKELMGDNELKLKELKEKQEKNSEEEKNSIQLSIDNINKSIGEQNLEIKKQKKYLVQLDVNIKKKTNENNKKLILSYEQEIEKIKVNKKKQEESVVLLHSDIEDLEYNKTLHERKNLVKQYTLNKEKLEKNEILMKNIDEEINVISSTLSAFEEDIKKQEDIIFMNKVTKTITNLYNSIDVAKLTKESKQRIWDDRSILVSDTAKKLLDITQKNKELDKESSSINETIDLYNLGKCPTCQTSFETDDFKSKISELEEKLFNLNKEKENNISLKESLEWQLRDFESDEKVSKVELENSNRALINAVNELTIYADSVVSYLPADIMEDAKNLKIDYNKVFEISFNKKELVPVLEDADVVSLDEKKKELSKKELILEENKNKRLGIVSENKIFTAVISESKQEDAEKIISEEYKVVDCDLTFEEFVESLSKKSLEKKSIDKVINDHNSKITSNELSIKMLNSSLIGESFFEQKNAENADIIEEFNVLYSEKYDKEISDSIESKILEIKNETVTLEQQLIELKSSLKSFEAIEENNIKNIEELAGKYLSQQSDYEKQHREISSTFNFLKVIEFDLSDSGIKSHIIKKIIPSINKGVNETLSKLEVPLVVKFDEEFKPLIYRFGKVVDTPSISTGQKKMIDSCILFTIIRYLINKCGGINLIFFDEIFSSLHTSAISTMMDIISKELVQELGVNVFLVNHSFVSSTFFDNVFEFYQKNHFSHVDIKTIEQYNIANG